MVPCLTLPVGIPSPVKLEQEEKEEEEDHHYDHHQLNLTEYFGYRKLIPLHLKKKKNQIEF